MANSTKKVPAKALQFNLGTCEFAAAEGDSKNVPVKMVARTGDAINHWWWGKCVHDFAGMQTHKPTLPIDYCHDPCEVLGYLDKFEKGNDLVVSGSLVPFAEKDRASEIIHKQKTGVPYEASISFYGGILRIEEVAAGVPVEVNGRKFEGPLTVFRQWDLRGVAICPYGADKMTSTQFAAGEGDAEVEVLSEIAASDTTTETSSTEQATEEAPADQGTAGGDDKGTTELAGGAGAGEAVPVTSPPATPPAAPGHAQFVTAFGDIGARWFLEGRTFADCSSEYLTQLREKHKTELEAKDTKITELQTKVDAAPRGDPGVSFSSADKDPKQAGQQYSGKLSPGIARFAAGIKLPIAVAAQ